MRNDLPIIGLVYLQFNLGSFPECELVNKYYHSQPAVFTARELENILISQFTPYQQFNGRSLTLCRTPQYRVTILIIQPIETFILH